MTKILSVYFTAAVVIMISGCCPNGCFVVTGEAYRRLAFPKPYLEKWEKPGASAEDRFQASEKCGGGRSPNSPYFSNSQIEAIRLPGESQNSAYSRRFNEFERCMKRQGYKFVGECYDNEISRSSPACGAP